jgi:AcrR family transcriptional regulator
VFASRGFREGTLRDICRRARANVAAVNYHFRSKERLYLQVLRDAFLRLQADHPLAPAASPPASPAEARGRLREVVGRVARGILEPRPSAHAMLLLREMIEPSVALDRLVQEFLRPRFQALREAVAPFLPGADERALTLHTLSVFGQLVYYRCAGPVALKFLGERAFTPALVDRIVEHVLAFTERALALPEALGGVAP